MTRPAGLAWRWLLVPSAVAALAQDPLTLSEAASLAQRQHPSVSGAQARVDAAGARVEQARSGYLPKVNYQESYQRSNNPVFVFSTLLTQRRFAESNFAIDALNNPSSLQNFQSAVSAEQMLFDAGMTRNQVQAAGLQRQLSAEEQRALANNLAAGAVRAYLGVLLAEESQKVAREAVVSAEADLQRAQSIRAAGMSTDADVLSIQVHLAAMREQEIRRRSDVEVARAALNEAMGLPLDAQRTLTSALVPVAELPAAPGEIEKRAVADRPDSRQAGLAVQLAEKQSSLARAGYLPQVSVRGGLEANRGRFVNQYGGNWFAGVTLRWNLFNGFADRARVQEATYSLAAAQSVRKQVDAAVALQVRRAHAELRAATERIQVAEAAVAQAEESLRIVRNRYEGGLSTVTDLLRNQVARLEAGLRRLAAVHDQRVAATMLELASGSLTPDSAALR